jgi:hypothetical protein
VDMGIQFFFNDTLSEYSKWVSWNVREWHDMEGSIWSAMTLAITVEGRRRTKGPSRDWV